MSRCQLYSPADCKCICQCCLADCEREQEDLDTGCVGQQVLCQLCWQCQVINLGGTVWHATPRINQQISCLSAVRLCKNMHSLWSAELPVAGVGKRRKKAWTERQKREGVTTETQETWAQEKMRQHEEHQAIISDTFSLFHCFTRLSS